MTDSIEETEITFDNLEAVLADRIIDAYVHMLTNNERYFSMAINMSVHGLPKEFPVMFGCAAKDFYKLKPELQDAVRDQLGEYFLEKVANIANL